jgi:hypothetical protein
MAPLFAPRLAASCRNVYKSNPGELLRTDLSREPEVIVGDFDAKSLKPVLEIPKAPSGELSIVGLRAPG